MKKTVFLFVIFTLSIAKVDASSDFLRKITSKHYVPKTMAELIPLSEIEDFLHRCWLKFLKGKKWFPPLHDPYPPISWEP